MKTKSTYFCYEQIEPVAPVTIRKHLTVYLSQSDTSYSVLKKQQNRQRILLEKNSLHCFIIGVCIRHVIFLWYILLLN